MSDELDKAVLNDGSQALSWLKKKKRTRMFWGLVFATTLFSQKNRIKMTMAISFSLLWTVFISTTYFSTCKKSWGGSHTKVRGGGDCRKILKRTPKRYQKMLVWSEQFLPLRLTFTWSYFSAQYPKRYHHTFDGSNFWFSHPKGCLNMNFNP